MDGNWRTGSIAARAFHAFNGTSIVAEQAEFVEFVFGVACGNIDESGAAIYFREYCKPVDGVTK